jgi:raffinose/stachyose/melibiose transport system permease protein
MITLLKAMSVIRLSNSRIGLGIQYWGFGYPDGHFHLLQFYEDHSEGDR